MNYEELADRFLRHTFQCRKYGHQKLIDEIMQGETFAILFISRQGGIVLPSEISSEMNISSARVAAMLNNLENKGLITRQIDKDDRRRVLVDLTAEGEELAEKHNQMVVGGTARMLEMLGEHDSKELVRITEKLAKLAPEILYNE